MNPPNLDPGASERPHAIVIGSGFGGLASAVRLGARGYRVTVLERRDQPGGRGYVYKQEGFTFDVAYTSVLKRAIRTLWITLDEMDLMWIPVERAWQLNERHYGSLQGLNKAETAKKFGDDQVLIWRRSYDTPPPALEESDERFPGNDPRYASLTKADLPLTECLKDTVARVLPYWNEKIVPDIKAGKRLIIAAHGNSLRALVKYLDNTRITLPSSALNGLLYAIDIIAPAVYLPTPGRASTSLYVFGNSCLFLTICCAASNIYLNLL